MINVNHTRMRLGLSHSGQHLFTSTENLINDSEVSDDLNQKLYIT